MVPINAISPIGAADPLLASSRMDGVAGPAPAGAGAVQLDGPPGVGAAGPPTGGSFVDAIGGAIEALNQQLVAADRSAADFAAGGSADLHAVMLDMQQASIGLQVGVAVRDKLLDAYQQLMHLQV